jgi:FG-GAP-like repeat
VPGVQLAQILGPLKNNGGPTQTHALVAGSPAIDAGDPGGCRDSSGALLQTDQRGFARHVDGNQDSTARCDIGAVEFGAGSATLVDFDGDGLSDMGVYRNGAWFIRRSFDGGITAVEWGGLPQDKPVPGDYDGDGKTDIAVYHSDGGNWFVVGSSAGFFTPAMNFGGSGFIPVPGDYDGDGETDAAVYQSSTGNWFVVGSSAGFFTPALNFGGPGFVPVPGDYDGDGETDAAVYQMSSGNWFAVGSSVEFFTPALNFGGAGYLPVPGDMMEMGRPMRPCIRRVAGIGLWWDRLWDSLLLH